MITSLISTSYVPFILVFKNLKLNTFKKLKYKFLEFLNLIFLDKFLNIVIKWKVYWKDSFKYIMNNFLDNIYFMFEYVRR